MPGSVPHTSTLALTNVTLPYVLELADSNLDCLNSNLSLLKGLNISKGEVCHKGVSDTFGLSYSEPQSLLQ